LTSATLDNETIKDFTEMWNVDSKGVEVKEKTPDYVEFIMYKLKINMFVDQFYEFERFKDV
jgi:hypothetical protein